MLNANVNYLSNAQFSANVISAILCQALLEKLNLLQLLHCLWPPKGRLL